MAKLTFLGAVEGVTGSMYLLHTGNQKLLLDCGLFQGRKEEEAANEEPFPFEPAEIDAVILSHAHLDHSGRIPLLVDQGFGGLVYMTKPTADLIEVLLKDAASLQERDAEWENKRRRRAGKPEVEPLYGLDEVEAALDACVALDYYQSRRIGEGVTLRFLEAGHILGSSIVELLISEGSEQKKLVFSGDLGNSQAALLRDPDPINSADVLLMESTYGDRDHRSMEDTLEEFENVITEAARNGGNILIPAFAVGRTQEIIFRLGELYQKGMLRDHDVYLDSPMAIAVTEIYHRYQNVFNAEDQDEIQRFAKQDVKQKSLHSFLPNLRYSITTEESIALNKVERGAIIIAGSGMCNGGRIRHHLKHNLWRHNAHLVFVGYQAMGTPGRALIEGAKTFKVAGEEVLVNAAIHTLGGFSAHASQTQLVEWLSHFEGKRPQLFLVHGEEDAKLALQTVLRDKGWQPTIPEIKQMIEF